MPPRERLITKEAILDATDTEIARLQQARRLLAQGPASPAAKQAKAQSKPNKKRQLSAEGRARIAAAQKRRGAAARKASK